ncbi:nose resistant to fluoxetine protein 6 [Trichonephila inaurata madagascariensis]|uniref:Nose resistant to fluoxetine protein 6 n=1 Tax=Trichonephila inaurata madagascariensis TaxID=2747483 RepID=A0A8X7C469_9ARAC|nr:nose resistant to fluoxetine protein 6 [Trichonephila inaurata madagascariensis]
MKYIFAFIFFVSYIISESQGQDESAFSIDMDQNIENMTVLERWQNFEKNLKKTANSAVKALLPRLMEGSGKMNISSSCMRDTMKLIAGLKNVKPWAIRFIDSSAKIMDGILVGSLSSFGAYDECIDTLATSERGRDKGKVLFTGQYCTIELKPPLPPKANFYKLNEVLPELKNFSEGGTVINEGAKYAHFFHFLSLRLGICVPSGCSVDDIDQVAQLVGKALTLHARASRCEVKEENKFDAINISVITAYSFAGLLMLIGSSIDIYSYYTGVAAVRVLLAFSLISNFQKFSNTKTSSDTLSCLNGIRFLCMSWVVLGHTYFNVNFQMFLGLEKVRAYAKDFAFQAVINATIGVDTFFCMGGLLVCYLTIKLVRIGGHPFSVKLYIFHRLWRILPVYTYVILFMFLGNLLGSGPIWYDTTHKYLQACHDNWWTNLIFINNFYNSDSMCIPQSWYIASDFQLYIAALLILLPMLRWPKVGISLCGLAILASIIYSGVGTYINEYPPTMLFAHPDPEQRINYWAKFYFRPFVHASPYCIGMLAGYLLAVKPDLKIPKGIQVAGWALAFIFNFSVLYGVVGWNRGAEPTLWGGLLYASLNRTAWTLGVSWMIVCCATGHGGVINYILSWKCFIPLGRLTFIVYLIHPIVQIAAVGNVRTQIQPDHFFAVWIYFGHMCITYGTAFAGTMLIESPLMSLEKIMFGKSEKKTEDSSIVKNNSVLKGTLKSEKNGDIAVMVHNDSNESLGIDNTAVVYKL